MSTGDSPNLVITGFMGTGKTRVAREVARRLGYPFVDMDAEIEARAGKPIPRLFAEDGEAAFRHMEAALCVELGSPSGRVIATGGGALVDPVSRAMVSYINDIGHRVAAFANETGHRFTFFVVDDPSINAFALPGGYIGVHTGLIEATRNENELAGVLAHEVAHVTQRHIARAIHAGQRQIRSGVAAGTPQQVARVGVENVQAVARDVRGVIGIVLSGVVATAEDQRAFAGVLRRTRDIDARQCRR